MLLKMMEKSLLACSPLSNGATGAMRRSGGYSRCMFCLNTAKQGFSGKCTYTLKTWFYQMKMLVESVFI